MVGNHLPTDSNLPLASLVHGLRSVSLPADTPLSPDRTARRMPDPNADALEMRVLPLLRGQAGDLAERWTAQARRTQLLTETSDQGTGQVSEALGLVDALVASFANGDDGSDDTIGRGMRFGAAAFARGVSVHHVLKALDLLMAMTLFAMESALGQVEVSTGTTAADGVRLARRLQRRGALLSLAATRGYMLAYTDALRDRFRHLRHDLRNPLGTIKSVLALMDDDSVPLEARVNPSFRAMATRNARSLEELIAERLGDVAALLPSVAGQEVSIRTIACTGRRELRAEAERRGVTISVEEDGPHGRLDAPGLELLLREVLQATLQECEPGEQLHIDFDRTAAQATLMISRESGRLPLREEVFDRLRVLAKQIGAAVSAGERTLVSIPFRAPEAEVPAELVRSVPGSAGELGDGESRHDVRGAREGHHGQAGAH
jgi:signal transduction histidine kinase